MWNAKSNVSPTIYYSVLSFPVWRMVMLTIQNVHPQLDGLPIKFVEKTYDQRFKEDLQCFDILGKVSDAVVNVAGFFHKAGGTCGIWLFKDERVKAA